MTDLMGTTRLVKLERGGYGYRRIYHEEVNLISAEAVEKAYRKYFPAEERNEEHVLVAVDIEAGEILCGLGLAY